MKPPQNTKELKTFLGFIQYLGKFMPNMATVGTPLRELLEKNIAGTGTKSKKQALKDSSRWPRQHRYLDTMIQANH